MEIRLPGSKPLRTWVKSPLKGYLDDWSDLTTLENDAWTTDTIIQITSEIWIKRQALKAQGKELQSRKRLMPFYLLGVTTIVSLPIRGSPWAHHRTSPTMTRPLRKPEKR